MVTTAATPKTADRQAAILKNSLEVFAHMGYQNADVQVIADQAGVGKGTVYRHFGNKEQLFLATAEHCRAELAAHIQRQMAADQTAEAFVDANGVAGFLRLVAREIARFYQDSPAAVEILIQERVHLRQLTHARHADLRANVKGLDAVLRYALAQGQLRQVPVESITDAFCDLLFGCLINAGTAQDRGGLVNQVEQSVELLLHGLLAVPDSRSSPKQRGTRQTG